MGASNFSEDVLAGRSTKYARVVEDLQERYGFDFVGMGRFTQQKAGALSYGQQKLVELAQVLMLEPDLVLLDEPAGGINPVLIDRMSEMIRELNRHGASFLIVEHNMNFVLNLCDPIHVVAQGRVLASGTPEQIKSDPAVIDAYLGDDFAAAGDSEVPEAPDPTEAVK